MKLRIAFKGPLRMVAQAETVDVELPDDATVARLLTALAEVSSPAVRPHLLTAQGTPQASLLVVVNGQGRPARDAETITLQPTDTIELYPPIAGG